MLKPCDIKVLKKFIVKKAGICLENEKKEIIKKLQNLELIQEVEKNYVITKQGLNFLKRLKTSHDMSYQYQHMVVEKEKIDSLDVLVNQTESPLKHLYMRKGKNGAKIISKTQFLAGERLRQDFEKAQMISLSSVRLTPKVDQSFAEKDRFYGQEKTVIARKRLNDALVDVGKEMDTLLLDVCCYLKGLETVEKERSWPARSAKVVLGLALNRLANYYGFHNEARGKTQAKTSSWHV